MLVHLTHLLSLSMPAMSSTASPLLALPLEIRTAIYSHLLTARLQPILLYHTQPGKPQPSLPLYCSILLVSKQIHYEAAPVLYNTNIYELKFHVYTHRESRHTSPLLPENFTEYERRCDALYHMAHIVVEVRYTHWWSYERVPTSFKTIGGLLLEFLRALEGGESQKCTWKELARSRFREKKTLRITLREISETKIHGIIRSVLQDHGHSTGMRTSDNFLDSVLENREVRVLGWRRRTECGGGRTKITGVLEDVTDNFLGGLRDFGCGPTYLD